MLKQWLLNDGKVDSITVEEKFTQWLEQLRTDRYVTVSCHVSELNRMIKLFVFKSQC